MRAVNIRCFVCQHRYHPGRGHCPTCGTKVTQVGHVRSYHNVSSGRPVARGESLSYEKMLNMAVEDRIDDSAEPQSEPVNVKSQVYASL